METVYIETTIVSVLTARPSQDAIMSSYQEITRRWWQGERHRYACVTSEEVLREASLGDAEMSRRRLEVLSGLPVLAVEEPDRSLAREVLAARILPPVAASDALHAVVASQRQVNILLTWNCRHLANPHLLRKLRQFMTGHGLVLPEICTPIELIGESIHG